MHCFPRPPPLTHPPRPPLRAAVEPFAALAARWRGLPEGSPVTPEERAHAKKLAYGIVYGMVSVERGEGG